jgi:hypothetical protein
MIDAPIPAHESKRERKRREAAEHNATGELRTHLRRIDNILSVRGASMTIDERTKLEDLRKEVVEALGPQRP